LEKIYATRLTYLAAHISKEIEIRILYCTVNKIAAEKGRTVIFLLLSSSSSDFVEDFAKFMVLFEPHMGTQSLARS